MIPRTIGEKMKKTAPFDTKMPINPTVLRAVRSSKGVSVHTIAEVCDRSDRLALMWEQGTAVPRLRDVLNICRYLKCSPRLLREDPVHLLHKLWTDIALSETLRTIEKLLKGESIGINNSDMQKLLEKLGVFNDDDFMFEDEMDKHNEAHNQVSSLVP